MDWKLPKIKVPSVLKSVLPSRYFGITNVDKTHRKEISDTLQSLRQQAIHLKNEHGWILSDCDAMLWQGIYSSVTRETHTLKKAMPEKGRYVRRPGLECHANGESASTWSRDMGVGLLWWLWRCGLVRELYDHKDYGDSHSWNMGYPTHLISRVQYTPSMIGLVHMLLNKMDGRKYEQAKIPQIYDSGLKDYHAHLQVLIIALVGEVQGKIPESALDRLKEHYTRAPKNPLYPCVLSRFDSKYTGAAIEAVRHPVYDTYFRDSNPAKIAELMFCCEYLIRGMV